MLSAAALMTVAMLPVVVLAGTGPSTTDVSSMLPRRGTSFTNRRMTKPTAIPGDQYQEDRGKGLVVGAHDDVAEGVR